MAYKVVWTNSARADAESIIRYIAVDLDSTSAAVEHLDAFEDAAREMGENPLLHAVSALPSLELRALRPCFVKRYVMLYSFDGDQVTVHRIFHMLQDYAKIIER